MVWRLVVGKIATLQEIETHYNLLDLLDANEALDLDLESQAQASKKASKPGG